MGDAQSKLVIENARKEIFASFNKDLLADNFLQKLYEHEKEAILNSFKLT